MKGDRALLIYITCFVSNRGMAKEVTVFYKILASCLAANGISRTVPLCPGYNAKLYSPSFDQQSNA